MEKSVAFFPLSRWNCIAHLLIHTYGTRICRAGESQNVNETQEIRVKGISSIPHHRCMQIYYFYILYDECNLLIFDTLFCLFHIQKLRVYFYDGQRVNIVNALSETRYIWSQWNGHIPFHAMKGKCAGWWWICYFFLSNACGHNLLFACHTFIRKSICMPKP